MLNPGIDIGEYGVREVGKSKEKVFHAHHTAKGRYRLVAHSDGRFEYIPVPRDKKKVH